MTPQSFFIEYWNLLNNKQARMVHDVTLSFLKKKKLEELERIYIMCLEDYIEKHLEGFFCFTIYLFFNHFPDGNFGSYGIVSEIENFSISLTML